MCDEYTLFVLAEWLGIYLTIVEGPSSDQSAVLEASFKRFRLQGLAASYSRVPGPGIEISIGAVHGAVGVKGEGVKKSLFTSWPLV